MREGFEKLGIVSEVLSECKTLFDTNENIYKPRNLVDTDLSDWLNAGWYVFQKQQKKIDEIKAKLSDIYDACDETNICMVLDEIQELLK